MNFVYIDGPPETVLGFRDIPDIILRLKGGETLPDGRARVTAYATDRAINEIETRGATVSIIFDNEELKQRTDELFPPDVA